MKLFRPVKWEEWKDWRMTQPFWTRPEVYWPMGFKGHMWLDFAWPKPWDTIPIYSSTDGIVDVRDTWEKWYWKHIVVTSIINGKPYEILYWHLSEIHVQDNQEVKVMQQIWIMGTSGFSSGVHLHWEIKDPTQMNNWYKGRFNPLPFVCEWIEKSDIEKVWERVVPVNKRNYIDYKDTSPATNWTVRMLCDLLAFNKWL